jgi:hypothetical protein
MLSFPTHYTNTNPTHTILYGPITVKLVEYLHISHDPDSCTYSILTTLYIPLYPYTHTHTVIVLHTGPFHLGIELKPYVQLPLLQYTKERQR